jgi:tRNA pseudouridine38-40 synthase
LSGTKPRRVKLVVAYDGTDFCGWAPQNGQRTVHGTLTQAVRQVSGEDNEITGASRTDGGAHAKGQVCTFDTRRPIRTSNWVRALNDVLPRDLTTVAAQFVARDFHPRFWAIDRWYRYRFLVGTRDPFRTRYTHEVWRPLDVQAMDQAARTLIGEHDFRAFSQLLLPETNTVREVRAARARAVKDEIWVDIVGTAFVRGMMRRISGALWEIGRGRRPEDWIRSLLRAAPAETGEWPPVLPAKGLTLMRVRYGRAPSEQVRLQELEENQD